MREVVETEQEFKQALFDYETAGWEVVEKAQGRAVLERDLAMVICIGRSTF